MRQHGDCALSRSRIYARWVWISRPKIRLSHGQLTASIAGLETKRMMVIFLGLPAPLSED